MSDAVAAFKKAGDKASYHFADDSCREFRAAARGFLWSLNHDRPAPGTSITRSAP